MFYSLSLTVSGRVFPFWCIALESLYYCLSTEPPRRLVELMETSDMGSPILSPSLSYRDAHGTELSPPSDLHSPTLANFMSKLTDGTDSSDNSKESQHESEADPAPQVLQDAGQLLATPALSSPSRCHGVTPD